MGSQILSRLEIMALKGRGTLGYDSILSRRSEPTCLSACPQDPSTNEEYSRNWALRLNIQPDSP